MIITKKVNQFNYLFDESMGKPVIMDQAIFPRFFQQVLHCIGWDGIACFTKFFVQRHLCPHVGVPRDLVPATIFAVNFCLLSLNWWILFLILVDRGSLHIKLIKWRSVHKPTWMIQWNKFPSVNNRMSFTCFEWDCSAFEVATFLLVLPDH